MMCSMPSRRHNWRLDSTAMGIVATTSGREGALKLGMTEMAMVVMSVGGPSIFPLFLGFRIFEFSRQNKKRGEEDPPDPLVEQEMGQHYCLRCAHQGEGVGGEKERPLLHVPIDSSTIKWDPRTERVLPCQSGNVCKTEGAGIKEVNT